MKTTQTKQINGQTPGPIRATRANEDFNEVFYEIEDDEAQKPFTALRAKDKTLLCAHDLSTMTETDARLLENSYNAFDRAGRALGIDASELAESVDIAEVLRMLEIARHNPDVRADMGPLTAEMVRLLSKLPKGNT